MNLSYRPIKRVAIIGAGPGGAAAAKVLTGLNLERLDVFEQQASFGGVWNYTNDPNGYIDVPQINPLEESTLDKSRSPGTNGGSEIDARFVSPMYEHLETNIPHILMKYSNAPSLERYQLFPTREAVIEYLDEYARSIKNFVWFQTQVVDVRRKDGNIDNDWIVRHKDLKSGKVNESAYDAVLVASGHFSVPTWPDITGMRDWSNVNRGVISHSRSYRRPDSFADKKVIIVGNAASGVDIASQIASVSKHPLLNSTRSDSPLSYAAEYKENVPEIQEFLPASRGRRAVSFSDGRVEEDIDAILFCTGYYYSFPFLTSICPPLISTGGERVQNLYKHIFYIPDPTLAFIGLPSKIIPFRTSESQAAVIGRVWSNLLGLPSQSDMIRWEKNVIAERGNGKSFHVLPFPKDFQYHNDLVQWARNAKDGMVSHPPPLWNEKETWLRERFPAIKKAFIDKGQDRCKVRTVEELGFDYEKWLENQDGESDQNMKCK